MVEFNPDGSIKLTGRLAEAVEENKQRMTGQKYITVKKEQVSYNSPKKCVLHIKLSQVFTENGFITAVYNLFRENATTPTILTKIDEKNFDIEIKTDFKRCSDCSKIIRLYKEFLEGRLIEEKATCTYEPRKFSYDDYFE